MRTGILLVLIGCGAEPRPLAPVVDVDVPPMEALPVDSGGQLQPQDTGVLPASAFGCPEGSIALGQVGWLDGIEIRFTRNDGAGICLWPDARPAAGTEDCRHEAWLPARVFERSEAELRDVGDEVHLCYRRIAVCEAGRIEVPAMWGPFGDCRGPWDEHVAAWLEAEEPAVVSER